MSNEDEQYKKGQSDALWWAVQFLLKASLDEELLALDAGEALRISAVKVGYEMSKYAPMSTTNFRHPMYTMEDTNADIPDKND
jgi:hypothetical protein